MMNRRTKAFTLVEILIVVVILGILAAIVIPQFTNASQDAQIGNVRTQLQTIRSQIELFRVKNNGNVPDLDGPDFNELITPPTGQDVYLRVAPVNPRNGSAVVSASADPGGAAGTGSGAVGWYYDAATGTLTCAGFDEATGTWRVASGS
ncbi:MAG: type II secretion system protein [Phycisphaerales bacterium]